MNILIRFELKSSKSYTFIRCLNAEHAHTILRKIADSPTNWVIVGDGTAGTILIDRQDIIVAGIIENKE